MAQAWEQLDAFLAADPETWGFWREWYKDILNGTPLPWDLSFRIATELGEEDWEKGAAHVAANIRTIRAAWIKDQANLSETLVFDEPNLVYTANPLVASNAKRLSLHLSRVDEALDDLVALSGNNGLTPETIEFRIVKRLVAKYGDDPERVAFDLTDVSHSVARQVQSGEYPDSEPFRVFQAVAIACVSTVCDMEPDVATELERVYPKPSQPPNQEELLVLSEAMRISQDVLDTKTTETTEEDMEELFRGRIIDASQRHDRLETNMLVGEYRSIVIRRQISRLWQISNDITKIDRLAEHYDSKYSKAAGVVFRYGSVGGLFLAAINALGAMLGLGG